MDENSSTRSSPIAQPAPTHWMLRVLVAVLLAEGLWGLIVAFTRGVLLPFLAAVMPADPQSPLYLGKGNLDLPMIFGAVLELCFAGIVAVCVNAWASRGIKTVRVKTIQVRTAGGPTASPLSAQSMPSISPVAQPSTAKTSSPAEPAPPPSINQAVPPPQQTAPAKQAAVSAKPQKPKDVYYNIVGEAISPMDED